MHDEECLQVDRLIADSPCFLRFPWAFHHQVWPRAAGVPSGKCAQVRRCPGGGNEGLVRSGGGAGPTRCAFFRLGLLSRPRVGRNSAWPAAMRRGMAPTVYYGTVACWRLALAAVCDLLAQHSEAGRSESTPALATLRSTAVRPFALPACSRTRLLPERCGQPSRPRSVTKNPRRRSRRPLRPLTPWRQSSSRTSADETIPYLGPSSIMSRRAGRPHPALHLRLLMGRHTDAVWKYEKALCLYRQLSCRCACRSLQRMGNTDAPPVRPGLPENLGAKKPQFPRSAPSLGQLPREPRGD